MLRRPGLCGVVLLAVVMGMLLSTSPTATAAARRHTTSQYALGKAKRCAPGFVKRTRRHAVNELKVHAGRKVLVRERVRYVACVYVPPAATPVPALSAPLPSSIGTTTTSTSTTTTTLPSVVAPITPGQLSTNWAGYVLSGNTGGYEGIGGQWTVPLLDCSTVPDGSHSEWVGVDGADGSSAIFQDGTESDCSNGVQQNYAWWTDDTNGYAGQILFLAGTGDVIQAAVAQASVGSWTYMVKDLTTGNVASGTEAFSAPVVCAEWITEDPTNGLTNQLTQFPPFSAVTFTQLSLLVPQGSWYLPSSNMAIEMVRQDGSVAALPGAVVGSGSSASFTVSYQSDVVHNSPLASG